VRRPEPDMALGRTHGWRPSKIIAWHKKRPPPGVGGRPVAGHAAPAGEYDDPAELSPARAGAILQHRAAMVSFDWG
jgi:hypothetical protein